MAGENEKRIRDTDAELAQIEAVLLDVRARLPRLIGDVQSARGRLAQVLASATPEQTELQAEMAAESEPTGSVPSGTSSERKRRK